MGKRLSDALNDNRQIAADAIGEILPAYMIPNRFVQVEEMPLNKNGKTDRKKLMESFVRKKGTK